MFTSSVLADPGLRTQMETLLRQYVDADPEVQLLHALEVVLRAYLATPVGAPGDVAHLGDMDRLLRELDTLRANRP